MKHPVIASFILVLGTLRVLAWMKEAIDAGNLLYMMAAFWGIVGWGFCMYLYLRYLAADASRPSAAPAAVANGSIKKD